jgi:tRNA(Ile)-lysidine synthetase-like protein
MNIEPPFLETFKKNLLDFNLSKGDAVLIALSGGVDSMCLLHLSVLTGLKVSAFHFNYGLRSIDSDKDQKLIEDYCAMHSVILHLRKASQSDFISSSGIQTKAREMRYKELDMIFNDGEYKAVFTAHHADDNAETVLMNLVRGSGIAGLGGIPVSRSYIFRPLYNIRKADIINYVKLAKIPWREDASNRTNKYRRNLFRNELLPALENKLPGISDGIIKSALQVSREHQNFNHLITQFKLSQSSDYGLFQILNPEKFLQFPNPADFGLRLFPEWNFSYTQWNNLLDAHKSKHYGSVFKSDTIEVILHKSLIFFRFNSQNLENPRLLTHQNKRFSLGQFCFFEGRSSHLPFFLLPPVQDFIVRYPAKGDKLLYRDKPSKLLSHILKENSIHPWLRKIWPVFTDRNHHILAVPGFFSFEESVFFNLNYKSTLRPFSWIYSETSLRPEP